MKLLSGTSMLEYLSLLYISCPLISYLCLRDLLMVVRIFGLSFCVEWDVHLLKEICLLDNLILTRNQI